MLKIDFAKLMQAPDSAIKSTTKKKAKAGKLKEPETQLHLGDYSRLQVLPDILSEEFLVGYGDSLDTFLLPYVSNNVISIGYASKYKEVIIENVFGNLHHLGILHYLKDKNVENKTDKELVAYAESLLVRGWHIRQEGHQYWLVNADFTRIIELTGKSPEAKSVEAMVFDEGAAHIFLSDPVASKFAALARSIGQDADELASSGNLDVLLAKVTDDKFGGYIVNYNAWRKILKKETKYQTMTDGISALDLYEKGFRLDSRITYPVSKASIMDSGKKKYAVIPVMPEITNGFNRYMVTALASKVKSDLLSSVKSVMVPETMELKELRHTYALMVEFWDNDFSGTTFFETLGVIKRAIAHVDSGAVSNSYRAKIMESLAAVFVTEAILLGNTHASLSSVSLDSISGMVYSYDTLDYFTEKVESLTDESVEEFSLNSLANMLTVSMSGSGKPLLLSMISYLPKSFMAALSSYEIDTKEYPHQFNQVIGYFNAAKNFVLERSM